MVCQYFDQSVQVTKSEHRTQRSIICVIFITAEPGIVGDRDNQRGWVEMVEWEITRQFSNQTRSAIFYFSYSYVYDWITGTIWISCSRNRQASVDIDISILIPPLSNPEITRCANKQNPHLLLWNLTPDYLVCNCITEGWQAILVSTKRTNICILLEFWLLVADFETGLGWFNSLLTIIFRLVM